MKEWAMTYPYLAFFEGLMFMILVSTALTQLTNLFKKEPMHFELKLPTSDQDEQVIVHTSSNSNGNIIN
jgi:hypothetical protein